MTDTKLSLSGVAFRDGRPLLSYTCLLRAPYDVSLAVVRGLMAWQDADMLVEEAAVDAVVRHECYRLALNILVRNPTEASFFSAAIAAALERVIDEVLEGSANRIDGGAEESPLSMHTEAGFIGAPRDTEGDEVAVPMSALKRPEELLSGAPEPDRHFQLSCLKGLELTEVGAAKLNLITYHLEGELGMEYDPTNTQLRGLVPELEKLFGSPLKMVLDVTEVYARDTSEDRKPNAHKFMLHLNIGYVDYSAEDLSTDDVAKAVSALILSHFPLTQQL